MIDDLTLDDFLDGKIKIWQPKQGYRAATDPVLLAAAVAAKPNQTVLELGCGVGVAISCLCRRVPELSAYGVEVQENYANLSNRNSVENNLEYATLYGDILNLPDPIRHMNFDEVFFNPPFFERNSATPPSDEHKTTAHLEGEADLSDWVSIALRRLKPLGYVTIIHLVERLPDILIELNSKAGDISILPLSARKNTGSSRVIIRARKGGKGPTKLLSPLVLHQGEAHTKDGDNFTQEARDILRNMAPIDM